MGSWTRPKPTPKPPPPRATLALVVTNARTGQPVAGAEILYSGFGGSGEGRANADGYWAQELPQGSYSYGAWAEGYRYQEAGPVDLRANTQLDLALEPDAAPGPPRLRVIGDRHSFVEILADA